MVAAPKIRGPKPCAFTEAALAVAELCNVKVDFELCDKFSVTTADGAEFDDVETCLRYFGRLRPDFALYGRNFTESLEVDSWLTKISSKFCVPLVAASQWKKAGGDVTKIFDDIAGRCSCLEKRSLDNTFLVCQRMSIADVLLAVIFNRFETMSPGFVERFPNLKRWASTVQGHPSVKKHMSSGAGVEKAQPQQQQQSKAAKKEKKEKPVAEADDVEAQIAAEEKAKAKKANPLDQLPPTKLVLDAWKREYSNSKDLVGKSMPWFWENFDAAGWSFWYMRYNKLEGENTVGYATSNMLGGFIQRLDNAFRKYSFAVINVVGQPGDYDIQGVWLLRGQEIPFELKDHPSFEYNTFRKLDPVADKALIEEYWTAEEKVEGKPIDSCKVWK